MTRTVVSKEDGLHDNSSLAYSTLCNRGRHNVPLPGSSASVAMGSAGGLLSSTRDLSKYHKALMKFWRVHVQGGKDSREADDEKAVFRRCLLAFRATSDHDGANPSGLKLCSRLDQKSATGHRQ